MAADVTSPAALANDVDHKALQKKFCEIICKVHRTLFKREHAGKKYDWRIQNWTKTFAVDMQSNLFLVSNFFKREFVFFKFDSTFFRKCLFSGKQQRF